VHPQIQLAIWREVKEARKFLSFSNIFPTKSRMSDSSPATDQHLGAFQLIVFVLSIYAVVVLAFDSFFHLYPEVSAVIQFFDNIVCAVFFLDFLVQLYQAEDKWTYMRFGWIDLIASIPNVDVLRWGRLARALRIIRVLRAMRATQKILRILVGGRSNVGLSAALTAFLLIIFSSIAILICEDGPKGNIKTAGDAIWWSITTITTVGYGDRFPVTPLGRCVAALLMISGVGLFGSFTAVLAAYVAGQSPEKNPSDNLTRQELSDLRREIAELKSACEKLERGATGR
jgi:voltage-gated potassium channel